MKNKIKIPLLAAFPDLVFLYKNIQHGEGLGNPVGMVRTVIRVTLAMCYFLFFTSASPTQNLRWPTRDTLQTKKKRCKQKRNAANKNETLQTKKKRCKQKRNAANKQGTLQTKKKRCKQKRSAANKKGNRCKYKKRNAANIKKGTLQIKKRNAANKKE